SGCPNVEPHLVLPVPLKRPSKRKLAPEKEPANEQHFRQDRCDRRCGGGTSRCSCSTYPGRSRTKRRVCSGGSSWSLGRRCAGRRICRVPVLRLSRVWRVLRISRASPCLRLPTVSTLPALVATVRARDHLRLASDGRADRSPIRAQAEIASSAQRQWVA